MISRSHRHQHRIHWGVWLLILGSLSPLPDSILAADIGREVAISRHLQNGEEFELSLPKLVQYGKELFAAHWTSQEGAGRPLTKGNRYVLDDPESPLVFPRNFNRISGPDANSCAGCHNIPFGITGGSGDVVANVFLLAQRFDFVDFDGRESTRMKGNLDELGVPATLSSIGNSRSSLGMFGSGFIEMLARQMTADLQAIRDSTQPGETKELKSKGISFGKIIRTKNGRWNTSQVDGVPPSSLNTNSVATDYGLQSPSLIIRPFHQSGSVVSIREFSNNAFNLHHGIQSEERFGTHVDADGDGIVNEVTRADVTAVCVFQATMAVPGRVIPNNKEIEDAVWRGEQKFQSIGCAGCHVPSLPLPDQGWIYSEPNPYNPTNNLRIGESPLLKVDLTSDELPGPRLKPDAKGILHVPAYTDLKLHDITDGYGDPNREPLNLNYPPGTGLFFSGNSKFLTRKLWDVGNAPNFYHHGKYTTIRQAVLAHSGEAKASRLAFEGLSGLEKDSIIEFLKSLQVLPAGAKSLVVDENGREKTWPPARFARTALAE